MKLFVYGTLKRGYGNNRLLSSSTFLGEAITTPDYALFASGIPFMKHGEYKVKGELYEIDEHTRNRVDRLEGHPDFYTRSPVSVEGHEGVEGYLILNATFGQILPENEGIQEWIR